MCIKMYVAVDTSNNIFECATQDTSANIGLND